MGRSASAAVPGCNLWASVAWPSNLLFDQIEVVEQPFSGRCNPAVGLNRLHQQIAGFNQETFILGRRVRSRSEARPKNSLCDSASALPCSFIWSLLNSSDRSGGSSPLGRFCRQ
jgi:hypothetical protein